VEWNEETDTGEDITEIFKFDLNSFTFRQVDSVPTTAIPAQAGISEANQEIINVMFTLKIENK